MKPCIFVPEPIAAAGMELLQETCTCIAPWADGADADETSPELALAVADGVLVRLFSMRADEIARAPRLKVIAKHGVGVDNIDVQAATARGIPVVYTPTANSNAVAEHTVALMLGMARHLHTAHAAVMAGRFHDRVRLSGIELAGKKLGVVGVGRIGSRVAKAAHAGFGMEVHVYDPFVSADQYSGPGTFAPSLDALLRIADFITLHVPLTPDTRNLLGADRLRLLKPGCHVINTSRGGVIDEAALAEALTSGHIAGAAIDVFETEPLPDGHPFLHAPNLLLTPHISSSTTESLERMALDAARGILDVLQGRQPAHLVNPGI